MAIRQERSRSRAKKFTGILAQPIVIKRYRPTLVGLTREEAAKKTAEGLVAAAQLSLVKLDHLFEHFALTKTGNQAGDYQALALRLAQEYIPGFRLVDADASRRGRPSRDPLDLIRLLADVEVAIRILRQNHSSASDAKALAYLTTKRPFVRRWGSYEGRERTLANMLTEARHPKRNPWHEFWEFKGQARTRKWIRKELINVFGITKSDY